MLLGCQMLEKLFYKKVVSYQKNTYSFFSFFDRFSKILIQFLNELENRYSAISTLLDGTEIFSRVSSSVTSSVRFEDIFNLADLSEDLVEAGLDSNTVKLLLQSFVNVNRVRHPFIIIHIITYHTSYILET